MTPNLYITFFKSDQVWLLLVMTETTYYDILLKQYYVN